MKNTLFSLFLAFSLLLCGCENQNQPQNDNDATTVSTPAPTQATTEHETAATSDTTAEAEEEPAEYDYVLAASFCDAINSFAVYMDSTIQFYYSYVDIMDLNDNDDIATDLSNALTMISEDVDLNDRIIESLDTAYEGLTAVGDPDILPLLKDCLDDYKSLSELVNNPAGACDEYLDDLALSYNYLIGSHNAAIEYLYSIGYYSDRELEAARIPAETNAAR